VAEEQRADQIQAAAAHGRGQIAAQRRSQTGEDTGALGLREQVDVGQTDDTECMGAAVFGKELPEIDHGSEGGGPGGIDARDSRLLAWFSRGIEMNVDEETEAGAAEFSAGIECSLHDDIERALGGKEQAGVDEQAQLVFAGDDGDCGRSGIEAPSGLGGDCRHTLLGCK
jgi:hypothetical protein